MDSPKVRNQEIQLIEFNMSFGCHQTAMVALFDIRDVSENEVRDAINLYPAGYDHRIVFMTKHQFETVFRSLQREGR